MGRFMHSPIFVFLFTALCSLLITSDGLTIKLTRRDEFDTDLFPGNLSDVEKYQIFADLSHSRALHLAEQARTRANLANPPLNQSTRSMPMKDQLRPKLTGMSFSLFAVQVTIGSKPYSAYLVFDTGSDMTWVQCTKCKGCFPVKDGPFNPDDSKTYHRLPLNDGRCGKSDKSGSDKEFCRFVARYPKRRVEGMTALEDVRFMTAPGSYETVENFVLGCAESATGFKSISRKDNRFAGIFGLGRLHVRDSFMDFTKERTKSKFSHCLPPWNAGLLGTNILFGDDAVQQPLPKSAKTIPMYVSPHYRVHCLDISVGGERLDQRLWPRVDGTGGGLILDTGSTVNLLVKEAYEKVERAFIRNLTSINVRPDAQPVDPYKLCYSSPLPRGAQLPSLSLHFVGGGELKIEFWNLFQNIKLPDRSEKACMMILPSTDKKTNSLGAISMANYRFVYDIEKRYLTFYPETCR